MSEHANRDDRSAAVSELARLAGDAPTILSPKPLQGALLALVKAENARTRGLYHDDRGASAAHGEGFGEYYAELIEVAMKAVASVQESRARRDWLTVLVQASYNPAAESHQVIAPAEELATRAGREMRWTS